ncbi:hypothetical protein OH540_09650 [Streptomyces sp. BPPL-273]|uniref:hypothetical protein n=1 Tax=Streptomyces sp. BPPL-273 TaxID=2987533 RepID=UPI0024AF3847|nr:hypothetical protein [Streptomyces sp. BPPL-273]WHM30287.1 hypothetical protein OH540_09650 [Streptomyces sp. BPPL-273]
MTAPQPTRTSPTAGLLNAMARLYIRRAVPFIAIQERQLDEARNEQHRLGTAASFRATEAAGYIDHSYLEKP